MAGVSRAILDCGLLLPLQQLLALEYPLRAARVHLLPAAAPWGQVTADAADEQVSASLHAASAQPCTEARKTGDEQVRACLHPPAWPCSNSVAYVPGADCHVFTPSPFQLGTWLPETLGRVLAVLFAAGRLSWREVEEEATRGWADMHKFWSGAAKTRYRRLAVFLQGQVLLVLVQAGVGHMVGGWVPLRGIRV